MSSIVVTSPANVTTMLDYEMATAFVPVAFEEIDQIRFPYTAVSAAWRESKDNNAHILLARLRALNQEVVAQMLPLLVVQCTDQINYARAKAAFEFCRELSIRILRHIVFRIDIRTAKNLIEEYSHRLSLFELFFVTTIFWPRRETTFKRLFRDECDRIGPHNFFMRMRDEMLNGTITCSFVMDLLLPYISPSFNMPLLVTLDVVVEALDELIASTAPVP
jgi:hypothetical protein